MLVATRWSHHPGKRQGVLTAGHQPGPGPQHPPHLNRNSTANTVITTSLKQNGAPPAPAPTRGVLWACQSTQGMLLLCTAKPCGPLPQRLRRRTWRDRETRNFEQLQALAGRKLCTTASITAVVDVRPHQI